MKKLTFNLSAKSISNLISSLDKLEQSVEEAKEESVKEVAEETVDIIKQTMAEASKIDTGELANSTQVTYEENKAIISQEGANAYAVEFGDAQYYDPSHYPDSSKIPPGVPIHTAGKDYYFKPKPNSTRWTKPGYAHGQYATAQMYTGKQYIEVALPEKVITKVRDKISKI